MSRESRLLLLTIVVCVVVLLLLARLRFPDPPSVETVAQPLERLAARASYDALAADIERVEAMIAPNLVVLRTVPRLETMPRRTSDVLEPPDLPNDVRHVAALRISPDMALAAIAPGVRIDGIVSGADAAFGVASVLATDPVRRLSRVRVPEAPSRPLADLPLAALRMPVYVVAVEGTQAGVTVRPVFLGRGNRFESARWSRPLLPVGGTAVTPGALIFSMSGEFIGCVVIEDGAPAIAGARDVLETVERLAAHPPPPATLGVSVQPLTGPLALATGAGRGVIISEVQADGPAEGALLPGDVVTALDGQTVDRPDRFLLAVASRTPGEVLRLTIVRNGAPADVSIEAANAGPVADTGGGAVTFERAPGGGTRAVRTRSQNGYWLTGLQPGDLILRAGEVSDPTPQRLREAIEALDGSRPLLLVIRRDGEQRVVAVGRSVRADARTD